MSSILGKSSEIAVVLIFGKNAKNVVYQYSSQKIWNGAKSGGTTLVY